MVAGEQSRFECTLCGECCRGNQKVWLNPTDLERLSAYLGLKIPGSGIDAQSVLVKKYIIVIEPGQHGVPRSRLRFPLTPAGRSCRFLVNDMGEDGLLRGRCSLHYTDAKPTVCRLAPLARIVDLVDGTEEWREVAPVVGCPGWGCSPPPTDGRLVAAPELPADLRGDLDGETEYFRELERDRMVSWRRN